MNLTIINISNAHNFISADFALEEWKRINNISQSLSLTRDQFDLLANNLGISQYLLENECVLPTNKTTRGWDNCKFLPLSSFAAIAYNKILRLVLS
jgi:hypothetical protein